MNFLWFLMLLAFSAPALGNEACENASELMDGTLQEIDSIQRQLFLEDPNIDAEDRALLKSRLYRLFKDLESLNSLRTESCTIEVEVTDSVAMCQDVGPKVAQLQRRIDGIKSRVNSVRTGIDRRETSLHDRESLLGKLGVAEKTVALANIPPFIAHIFSKQVEPKLNKRVFKTLKISALPLTMALILIEIEKLEIERIASLEKVAIHEQEIVEEALLAEIDVLTGVLSLVSYENQNLCKEAQL